ncbi:MAG: hypothetical protein J5I93_17745 [Pirellulaceae bacterium]|nr:hypothetical protein [Pirellulaceae bacterium]
MTRIRSLLCRGVCVLALIPAGCRTTEEVSEPAAPASSDWSSEFRTQDTDTLPLGLSSRAREIERSVGVGR